MKNFKDLKDKMTPERIAKIDAEVSAAIEEIDRADPLRNPKHPIARAFAGRGGPGAIVTFQEKYGARTFAVPDLATWLRVCLKVATGRLDGWYKDTKPEEPPKPAYTEEQARALMGPAQKAALGQIHDYVHELRRYELDAEEYALIERIRGGDAVAACELIRMRKDHEYERYTFDELESPDLDPVQE